MRITGVAELLSILTPRPSPDQLIRLSSSGDSSVGQKLRTLL